MASSIDWIKSKAKEVNRIELKKEIDGIDGVYIEKIFTGRIPFRMISDIMKVCKSNGGTNAVSYYYRNHEDGSGESFRISAYAGNNLIKASFGIVEETVHPSEGVTAVMTIEKIDGENLDTSVSLDGGFCVAGRQRKEFMEKLGTLIDEYRI